MFLVGENHGIAFNSKIKLLLLKNLVHNANVKYFLIEAGHFDSLRFNRFLECGQSKLLDAIFSDYRGSYIGTKEEYDFWIGLYTFNSSLPLEKKIKVIGIDSISDIRQSLDYIIGMFNNGGDPPNDIKNVIELLAVLQSVYKGENKKTDVAEIWLTFMSSLINSREQYALYLGKSFPDFMKVGNDMITAIKRGMNFTKAREIREQYMFSRTVEEITEHNDEFNYFGQFGNSHVGSPFNIIEPYSNRLNNHNASPVQNAVIRICCLYNNCQGLMDSGKRFVTKRISFPIPLQQLLEGVFSSGAAIVKMNHTLSPFTILQRKEDAFLCDFHPENVQYCIVINGSDASEEI